MSSLDMGAYIEGLQQVDLRLQAGGWEWKPGAAQADAHHDLAEFAPRYIAQLYFPRGHGLPSCTIGHAWTPPASRLQNEHHGRTRRHPVYLPKRALCPTIIVQMGTGKGEFAHRGAVTLHIVIEDPRLLVSQVRFWRRARKLEGV
jgi:hypothetical protein